MGSRPHVVAYVLAGVAFLLVTLAVGGRAPAVAGSRSRVAGTSGTIAMAPIRRIGTPGPLVHGANGFSGTSETSGNWAGYDVTGSDFTSVTASWTQPAASSTSSNGSDTAFWVGLDGDGSETVEQIGTEAYKANGSVHYDAWYEMYPSNMVTIHSLTISPGDEITATVTANGAGGFTLTLADATTQVSFSKTLSNGVTKPKSAEVIAEAPTDATTGDLLALTDFDTLDFTGCAFDGQSISAFDWNRIDMVSDSGTTLVTTSALGSDGASFTVSQPATADVTPPTTTVHGAGGWHHKAVTLTFSATDAGGSGVAYTQYRLGAGAWTDGTTLTVAAPASHAGDGPHTVRYRSVDSDGNVETTHSCTVGVDTRRPKVTANWSATVSRGHTAALQYVVSDSRPGSPTANVTIRVKTAKGRLVKKLVVARAAVDRRLTARFVCGLAKGRYRFVVSAVDAAGNVQSAVDSNTLTVR